MAESAQGNGRSVIVGLGASGLAAARYLSRQGVPVAVTDTRAEPPGADSVRALGSDIQLHLGGIDAALLRSAAEVVLSPGIAPDHPAVVAAVAAGVPVVGEMELFARVARAPVVAITGSNGKSTVTTLVGQMAARGGLDVAVGGNLGTPALELFREPEPDLYVLEISSFQLETLSSLRPVAATVLNVSADHLDRHGDMERYASIKAGVYAGEGLMVLNRDDPLVRRMARPGRASISFGASEPVSARDYGLRRRQEEIWLCQGQNMLLPAGALRIRGQHNLVNALAALALAEHAGVERGAALDALRNFAGLPHRMQWVARRAGMDWINDSKATNVGATLAAVEGLEQPLLLIAGGDGKGADFSPLATALAERARVAILLGRAAPLLEQVLAPVLPVERVADMEQAVKRAAELGRPGDLVLLSPACASLDMYSNYMARGDAFAAAVGRLTA
ncbi:MAG: UDP-N-acetylmuramoyl-L-alanine--D-glutamate ligase [Ectothiorhodospiraceae bacterium]|nr:UDP-N-acetylmuramoyl-L-alanine--D-glutamate ligase [Ectothiorhodospiraceae bacterium]